MKAILISINPKWVAKILNGEKTLEIRKTMPKCDFPIDVYIYCTRGNGIKDFITMYKHDLSNDEIGGCYINGTVIAKFTLNKVDLIRIRFNAYCGGELSQDGLCKYACLSLGELDKYLNAKNGYAWHIDNLEIFGEPKEISEFKTRHYPQYAGLVKNETHYELVPLTRAPESWCYIEV